jgi:hypothetical protein
MSRSEDIAQLVYNTWKDREGWVPWVERGNSHRQTDARQVARAIEAAWNTRAPSALPAGWINLARDIGGVANLLEHRMSTEGNMERENTRRAIETLRAAVAMLSASPPADHVPDVGNMISPSSTLQKMQIAPQPEPGVK